MIMQNKQPIIFIDRDGTIIREPADEQIDSLTKLEFLPGAITALSRLSASPYLLVMVTNQDGLGTPSFPEQTFWPAHNMMLKTLEGEGVAWDDILIDRTFPHQNAPTRKPGTAMLTKYLNGNYDLENSFVIGDRLSDMKLAQNLGAHGLMLNIEGVTQPPASKHESFTTWAEIAERILGSKRMATLQRTTAETDISIKIDLDPSPYAHQLYGHAQISTGLCFFDHMLNQLPHHAGIYLNLICRGDLRVDEHHTIEDVAIALGTALKQALGNKAGIERYGFVLPMDESAAMVLLDLGGRAELVWDVTFTREYVGDVPTEMFHHFFKSLATALGANINIQARGENNHHLIEGVFKAFARALKAAIHRQPFNYTLPSSKGVL